MDFYYFVLLFSTIFTLGNLFYVAQFLKRPMDDNSHGLITVLALLIGGWQIILGVLNIALKGDWAFGLMWLFLGLFNFFNFLLYVWGGVSQKSS